MLMGVVGSNQSQALHHIVKISDAPKLRMNRSNWLAVCDDCHEMLELDQAKAKRVKQWSDNNYDRVLG